MEAGLNLNRQVHSVFKLLNREGPTNPYGAQNIGGNLIMNKNAELQLEVLQDWRPGVNAENMGITVEDGIVNLSGDVSRFFENIAGGRWGQEETRTASPKSQYIAGLLVIRRREADTLPRQAAHSATVESWIGAPTMIRYDGPEIFLSTREIEVLSLIAAGQSNQEIAGQLCLALNTVKRHAYNIYAKLDVKNRTQAVSKARRLGLIT